MRKLDTDMLSRIEALESRLEDLGSVEVGDTGSTYTFTPLAEDGYTEIDTIHLPWLKAGETVWIEADNGMRLRLHADEDFQITQIGIEEPV